MSKTRTPTGLPRQRSLGFWSCTALVMGNMIGSGIYLLPRDLAVYGGISLLGWLVTTLGALSLALMFAQLARTLPRAGGACAYSQAGLGDFAGFLVAWGYWISMLAGNAAIAVAMVGSLSWFWAPLGSDPVVGAAAAMGAVAMFTWINVLGVRTAGRVQVYSTILKIIPLAAIAVCGLWWLEPSHFQPFHRGGGSGWSAVNATAALTLWAFLGLDSATVPADDVVNPGRTIPRATLVGTALTALIYVTSSVAVMGLVPPGELERSVTPFADAAGMIWGSWGGAVIAAGAGVACMGALNGWILNTGQIPAAAARDGFFPRFFASGAAGSAPTVALVLSGVLVCLLIAAKYHNGLGQLFNFAILLSTMTVLVAYVFSAVAQVLLLQREDSAVRGWRLIRILAATGAAFVYSVWAIAGTGYESVYWGFLLLLAGMPVYAVRNLRMGRAIRR